MKKSGNKNIKKSGNKNIKKSEDLAQSIQEKYGLILYEAGAGGDCLYHAIADQLARNGVVSSQTGQPFTYQALRHLAVAHITNNPEIYTDEQCAAASSQRPEAIGGALQNRAAYLAAHSRDREFGDDLIRSAISRELGVTITTINHASPEPITQRQEPENAQLYVYYTGGHYQSLIPIRDNPQFQALQAQVIAHDADDMIAYTIHADDLLRAGVGAAALPGAAAVPAQAADSGIHSSRAEDEKQSLKLLQSMPLEAKLGNFQASIEHALDKKLPMAELQESIEVNLQSITPADSVVISAIAAHVTNQIFTNKSSPRETIIKNVVGFVKTLAEANEASRAMNAHKGEEPSERVVHSSLRTQSAVKAK